MGIGSDASSSGSPQTLYIACKGHSHGVQLVYWSTSHGQLKYF